MKHAPPNSPLNNGPIKSIDNLTVPTSAAANNTSG